MVNLFVKQWDSLSGNVMVVGLILSFATQHAMRHILGVLPLGSCCLPTMYCIQCEAENIAYNQLL